MRWWKWPGGLSASGDVPGVRSPAGGQWGICGDCSDQWCKVCPPQTISKNALCESS